MLFAILAPLVLTARIQGGISRNPLGVGLGMAYQQFLGDAGQVNTADS